jgi:hypothetical protein
MEELVIHPHTFSFFIFEISYKLFELFKEEDTQVCQKPEKNNQTILFCSNDIG